MQACERFPAAAVAAEVPGTGSFAGAREGACDRESGHRPVLRAGRFDVVGAGGFVAVVVAVVEPLMEPAMVVCCEEEEVADLLRPEDEVGGWGAGG